jgi:hypothetical protein
MVFKCFSCLTPMELQVIRDCELESCEQPSLAAGAIASALLALFVLARSYADSIQFRIPKRPVVSQAAVF